MRNIINSLTKTLIMDKYTGFEKRIIVAILIAIMEADGIIDPHETKFLDNVIIDFEMDQKELDQISEYDFNLVIHDFGRFSSEKKIAAKKLFIGMAECDGYADPRELKIINSLG